MYGPIKENWMTTNARFFMIFAALATLSGGCAVQNEDYCADDSDCLALGQVCHDEGHFCHEACVKDDDCTDPTRPGYLATRPFCNPTSGDCVTGGTDGGLPDKQVPTKKKGEACGGDGECLSSHCVGSVCCDKACDDASSCTDGKVTEPSCVTGTCQVATNPCYGYTCNAAKDACRIDCKDKTDCTGTFECVGTECVNDLADGANCGTNDKACKSGLCVDTVCCATTCPGLCVSCNVSGKAGTCAAVTAGNDPDGDCKGTSAACNGSCDGAKSCNFPDASQSCGSLSCSAGSLISPLCDGKGGCVDQKKSCSPYFCDAGGKACTTSCADHTGCVGSSACDRSQAHADPKGLGSCVDTNKIVTVGASEEITIALGKVTAAKPYVVIPPKPSPQTYSSMLTISGKTVHLIGKGTSTNQVILDPSGGPAIAVLDASTVSIQGMTISGATSVTGNGVQCSVISTKSTLSIFESQIRNNTEIGVTSLGCDVTIRRSVVSDNDGGGARLANGAVTLANTLITDNGKLNASDLGGLELAPKGAPALHNLTVANNLAKSNSPLTIAAGVICKSAATINSSILWGNVGGGQQLGCTFKHSDVQGGVTGSTNLKVKPDFFNESSGNFSLKTTSPLIDKGAGSASSSIDLANSLRLKGSAVDMGAYEIK
jgi:hypothetical protein